MADTGQDGRIRVNHHSYVTVNLTGRDVLGQNGVEYTMSLVGFNLAQSTIIQMCRPWLGDPVLVWARSMSNTGDRC